MVEMMHALDLVGRRRRGFGDRSPPAGRNLLGRIVAVCVALPSCGTPGVGLLGDLDADAIGDGDGDGHADGSPSCTFSVAESPDGETVTCGIEPGSLAACADVAECLCRARNPAAESVDIDECIGGELTLRAMITLADFCGTSPAYDDIEEALRAYFGSLGMGDRLRVSTGCAAVPALAGDAPYAECLSLSGRYCPCIPGPCDADIIVGRRCAGLTRDEVLCIHGRMVEYGEHVCEVDLAAVLDDCLADSS